MKASRYLRAKMNPKQRRADNARINEYRRLKKGGLPRPEYNGRPIPNELEFKQ